MPRKTSKKAVRYKIVATELWGNAKDGFDSNNWHKLETRTVEGGYSNRYLVQWVRNLFEGRNFNWSENVSRPMARHGIEITDIGADSMLQVEYRGHYVGEVQFDTLCPSCNEAERHHFNRNCQQVRELVS